ncbi:MAG: metallophosphoesterase family protein [Planctomycetes bacterium]|nr:metallophosphoesterase family protein [Planctomycetota bacterium]
MAYLRTSPWRAFGLVVLALSAILVACSGGGSSGGAASTSTTTAPVNTNTTGSQAAGVTSLTDPGALLAGLADVTFRLSDPASMPLKVAVLWSDDQGQTWRPVAAVTSLAQPAATSPDPGVEHTLTWDTAQDVPGFAPNVLVEVRTDTTSLRAGPFAIDNQSISTKAGLSRHPYLQSTTDTSTWIRWRTLGQRDGSIEFGETPVLGQLVAGSGSTEDHEVQLLGLNPGTRYYYQLVSQGQPITPRYSFRTAPAANSADFRFLVVGDTGMNNTAQLEIAARMATEDADFFLHTGDVIYPAGGIGASVSEYNARYFRPYQAFLSRIPGFPVVGNHDLYGLYGQPFRDAFTLPSNGTGGNLEELYYSFEWGDAKFIAVESNTLFQYSATGIHMSWLSRELRQNTKKWVVVYLHAPLYSAGAHGDNVALQTNLGSLFENYGVDLVVAGHDHNYERSLPVKAFNTDPSYPGLVHIVTGGGGADLRPVNPTANTDVAISAYHYMRFEIKGDVMTGEAVTERGAVIDRFQIRNQ